VVNSSYETVLAILHDPKTLAGLSPMVENVVCSDTEPDTYTITDRFHFLGLSSTMNYTAKITILPNGSDFETRAGAGTVINNIWTAEPVEGGINVVEVAQVTVYVLFLPFVCQTIERSHGALLAALVEKVDASDRQALTS